MKIHRKTVDSNEETTIVCVHCFDCFVSCGYWLITQKGNPRFLEARMTSQIEDFIPVDTVSKYSKDSAKLFAWFVYDNFNNDTLEIE